MGDKWIWIAASLAYGIVSGLTYALICLRKGRKGFLRRFAVWSALYATFGLILCRILWALFST